MRGSAAIGAVWHDLPFWFLWLAAFALLDFDLNQLGGAILPGLVAFALPFSVVTLIFGRTGRRAGAWVPYGLISSALLMLILLGWTGPSLDASARLRIFEVATLVEFALLGVHAWCVAGRRVFSLIFGVGLVYGLILENAGVAMAFFAEEGYLIYLPFLPAPLSTALGWSVVFYPLWWIVPRLVAQGAGHVRRALVAVGVALAFDLQLDPLATAAGFWEWHPDLPPVIRGVPLVNFNAWAAAVFPFSAAAFRADQLPGSPARRVAAGLPRILGMAAALILMLIGITEARHGWPALGLFGNALRSVFGLRA